MVRTNGIQETYLSSGVNAIRSNLSGFLSNARKITQRNKSNSQTVAKAVACYANSSVADGHTVAREIENDRSFKEKFAHYWDTISRPLSARPKSASESRDEVASATNVAGGSPNVTTTSNEIENSRSSVEKIGRAWKQFAGGIYSYSFGIVGHPIKV